MAKFADKVAESRESTQQPKDFKDRVLGLTERLDHLIIPPDSDTSVKDPATKFTDKVTKLTNRIDQWLR